MSSDTNRLRAKTPLNETSRLLRSQSQSVKKEDPIAILNNLKESVVETKKRTQSASEIFSNYDLYMEKGKKKADSAIRSKDKPITKSRQFVQEAMDELKAMTNGIIPLEIPFVQSVIKNHANTSGGKERSALCKAEEETKTVALLAKRNQHLAEQIKGAEASIDEQIAVIDTELEWVDDVLEMIRALGIKVKGDGMK